MDFRVRHTMDGTVAWGSWSELDIDIQSAVRPLVYHLRAISVQREIPDIVRLATKSAKIRAATKDSHWIATRGCFRGLKALCSMLRPRRPGSWCLVPWLPALLPLRRHAGDSGSCPSSGSPGCHTGASAHFEGPGLCRYSQRPHGV